MAKKLPPVHPGEVLLEDFLKPLGLSQYRLAKGLSVPPRRINEIVLAKRAVTADTALRLARFFGTSDRFWLNLQAAYDLDTERDRLGRRLETEVKVLRRAGPRLIFEPFARVR
ncbi:MAG: addiction module antidote protein, HigA family [Acidobacteria bacterium]|nr:MAG: addiction module antidote protein, HigA family [Acidobacteriota bacterium]